MDDDESANERRPLLQADAFISEEAPVDPFTLRLRFSCYDYFKVRSALILQAVLRANNESPSQMCVFSHPIDCHQQYLVVSVALVPSGSAGRCDGKLPLHAFHSVPRVRRREPPAAHRLEKVYSEVTGGGGRRRRPGWKRKGCV